jgi:hypothetical protein
MYLLNESRDSLMELLAKILKWNKENTSDEAYLITVNLFTLIRIMYSA